MGGQGWTDAAALEIGDLLISSDGTPLRLAGTAWLSGKQTATVEGFHTYFVGEAGAWVHNACPPKETKGRSGAEAERAKNLEKRFPKKVLGPSGRPKIHTKKHPTLKKSKDAAQSLVQDRVVAP